MRCFRHVAITEATNRYNYFSGKPMPSYRKCSVNDGILLKQVQRNSLCTWGLGLNGPKRLDNRGTAVWFLAGGRQVSLLPSIQTSSGYNPDFSMEPAARSHRVKRPACEGNHSPPPTVKAKNEWSYAHTPLCAFVSCVETNTPLLAATTMMTAENTIQLSNFQLLKKECVP